VYREGPQGAGGAQRHTCFKIIIVVLPMVDTVYVKEKVLKYVMRAYTLKIIPCYDLRFVMYNTIYVNNL
jgi:hypothetical protein